MKQPQEMVKSRKHKAPPPWAAIIRVAMVVIMVLFQVGLCALFIRILQEYAVAVYMLLEVLSGVIIVALISAQEDASTRYAWVLVVLMLGVFGLVLYLLWGRGTGRNALGKRLMAMVPRRAERAPLDPATLDQLVQQHPQAQRMARYLSNQGFAVYKETKTSFYALGEHAFDAILADMEQAKAFIHIEFFIVFNGEVFERFFDVMARKAAEGVQVRLMYDDMGSLPTTDLSFLERLKSAGIQVRVFNPVHTYTHQLYLNYRDHRKIVIIDGLVAYTGGINIGDEYANLYPKHGHWKDTAVRLEGPAARGLTAFFAQMWEALSKGDSPLTVPVPPPQADAPGFVQPYEDGPHNNPNNPAESIYRQVIGAAQRTLYATTPYLIIDDILLDSLCTAAQSGVDVRLILPHIPDHWYVHLVSQSFYGELIRAGVRVYEYTPGFIHAKMMACDQTIATVGTINMDYRSFNLHYECGVLFTGGQMPETVHRDIEATLAACEEIQLDAWEHRKWYIKALQPIFRLFAPLM